MYLIKNAWRNVCRNIGKNILLGIIALVIGSSCCLSLSIRQAAGNQRESGLDELNITASIGIDRMSIMQRGNSEEEETPWKESNPKDMLHSVSSLSLAQYQTYAKAESVKDFYYTESVSLNKGSLEPMESTQESMGRTNGMGKEMQMSSADFTLIGYSSLDAMSEFVEGSAVIEEGTIFSMEAENECILSSELAEYNAIAAGDSIQLVNPNNENESVSLKVTGIYSSTAGSMTMGRMMSDPANEIYTSTAVVDALIAASETASAENAITASLSGTYVFEDIAAYEAFEEEARALGLSKDYTVSSQDVNRYEQSLQPLESLSEYATIFLIVILVIGSMVLIMLHMYHIRERKYEIGVLAAIGMNKKKISMQFICEIFVVTVSAMMIGSGMGACVSVPVTNALLAQTSSSAQERSFGRMEDSESAKEAMDPSSDMMQKGQQFLSEINRATDLMVVLQVCAVAILLTMVSGGVAVMSILRYEPLKILSDRE